MEVPFLSSMLLQSIQVGQARTIVDEGPSDLPTRPLTTAIWKDPVTGPVQVDSEGLAGDQQVDRKHHGGPWRAVLMYPADHYPAWREEWGRPDLGPGAFGENLTVTGISEHTACIGDQFEIGEVLLEVTSPRAPCHVVARRHGIPDLVATIRQNHRHGWYLRVVRPGLIEAGQEVRLVARPWPEWNVARVAEVKWCREKFAADAARLAGCPALSPEWREALGV
jgi:MOSC domain-containing protein YiiM